MMRKVYLLSVIVALGIFGLLWWRKDVHYKQQEGLFGRTIAVLTQAQSATIDQYLKLRDSVGLARAKDELKQARNNAKKGPIDQRFWTLGLKLAQAVQQLKQTNDPRLVAEIDSAMTVYRQLAPLAWSQPIAQAGDGKLRKEYAEVASWMARFKLAQCNTDTLPEVLCRKGLE